MNSLRKFSEHRSALVLAALMLAASGAGAADRTATGGDIAVKYSQEQVTNTVEAENLYKKLRAAARTVCGGDASGFVTLEVRTRTQRCYKRVLDDAVGKIDQPLLTAVHEAKAGKSEKVG